jgi:hypothetical protein
MPGGMSGREVASRARQLRPGIKVLLTSGMPRNWSTGTTWNARSLSCCENPITRLNSSPPFVRSWRRAWGDPARKDAGFTPLIAVKVGVAISTIWDVERRAVRMRAQPRFTSNHDGLTWKRLPSRLSLSFLTQGFR